MEVSSSNMFLARLTVYTLFSPSPSGAVWPESVENAIRDPVGGGIFANPLLFNDRVVFQFDSKGLSRHASRTRILTSFVCDFRNFITS